MKRPWVELREGSVFICFEIASGEKTTVLSYACTVEGAIEFANELAEQLKRLTTDPEFLKRVAHSGVSGVVDLIWRRKP